jgi:hypothetical protein
MSEGKKLFIATPMYGGLANAGYISSLLALQKACMELRIGVQIGFLVNESLITRGRNKLAHLFLKSDCTHLLFLDSDIQFEAHDVVSLLLLEKEVVGGPYSKKFINWERVADAARKGVAPQMLPVAGTNPVLNLKAGAGNWDISQPIEVSELGTGMLMIQRAVLEKMREAWPEDTYVDDVEPSRETIFRFFDCAVRDARYLSEDYFFCRRWADLGGSVFVCPWMRTTHFGTHGFVTDLPSLAANQIAL